jgi:hypothetical protein
MLPIHGERGKLYYGVKCGNQNCRESLALIELPPRASSEQSQEIRRQLQDLTVRCLMCTQETLVSERQIFVLEVR